MRNMLRVYGVALAFVLLAFFGGWAIQASAQKDARELRGAQVRSCERVNALRESVASFLKTARDARIAEGNLEVARGYQRELDRLMSVEHAYPGSARINCEEAFEEP